MHLCGLDIHAFLDGAPLWMNGHVGHQSPTPRRSLPHSGPPMMSTRLHFFPYVDALRSLGRYTQQLVMESLGKETNRQGETVRTGLTVIGNKGVPTSTR